MIPLQINYGRCQACTPCLAADVCRVRAIVQPDPDDSPYLDLERCYDCRLCLPTCPFGAIVVTSPVAN
jgi:Fe-S-cluster-containing hydrogenase component 2